MKKLILIAALLAPLARADFLIHPNPTNLYSGNLL
jgi:hypothetical protein